MRFIAAISAAAALVGSSLAQDAPTFPFPTTCSGVSAARYANTVDPGWEMTKILGSLTQPRTIIFDPAGHMLVLQATSGISVHTFGEDGCVASSKSLVQDAGLNHGLSLTPDGTTLYASSQTAAYSWTYDPATQALSNQKTIISGISQGVHFTRTILVSPKNPDLVIVSVGSNNNWDYATSSPGAGRSIVKVFDATAAPASGYNFNTEGTVLAYGLRNSVALGFDPNGHVWASENSGDSFTLNNQDIHIDNPAEELNYLGDPENPPADNWFGYPTCFTVWSPTPFPGLETGSQFVPQPNTTFPDDASCEAASKPPRLSFLAHMAPITNAFHPSGDALYITFHGSWNRQPASGYKVLEIPFQQNADGVYDPVPAANAQTFGTDVFAASSPSGCNSPSLTMSTCMRLAGLAWEPAGERLFVSSDNQAEGEIFVLHKKA